MEIKTSSIARTSILLATTFISIILAYQNHNWSQEYKDKISSLEATLERQKHEYEARIANLIQQPTTPVSILKVNPLAPQPESRTIANPNNNAPMNEFFVSQMLGALENPNIRDRAAALRELARLAHVTNNARAREILLTSLSDPNPEIRLEAARGIGLLKDPDLIYTLEPLANDPDSEVRQAVLDAVIRTSHSPDVSGPIVTKFLGDSDTKIARKALRDIAQLNYSQALDLVNDLTLSDNLEIAAGAGFTARSLGDDRTADNAVSYVAQGLESSNSRERSKALERIGYVGGRAAIPYLESALLDPDPDVRSDAQFYLDDVKQFIKIKG